MTQSAAESVQLALWSRNEAVTRAGQNANPDWMDEAGLAVFGVALLRSTFTTDDVWEALVGNTALTHEPRAMGAVMIWAVKQGYCTPSDTYRVSTRRRCHSRPLRVWASLLHPDARDDVMATKDLTRVTEELVAIKALLVELVDIQLKVLERGP